jgi:Asp-tRNA(Asn)/Glu-tRNA(Gln) amidotransferase A subunit family amidase
MARIFSQVDLLLVPSLRDEMLTISNFTGHPSLTLRAGFGQVPRRGATGRPIQSDRFRHSRGRGAPHGVTLIGRLFEEGTIGRVGVAIERAFGVAAERPGGF